MPGPRGLMRLSGPGRGLMMNSGGAFTPRQITGLTLWLNADDLAGADGSAVTSWVSKEGNAYNFAQATGSKQPALKKAANGINGHNTVLFGGDDLLVLASAPLTGAAGTVFAVYRLSSSPSDYQHILSSCDEATINYTIRFVGFYMGATPNVAMTQRDNGDVADECTGNTAILAGSTYITMWQSSGTAWAFRVNGAAQTLTAQSGLNRGDWFSDTTNRDNTVIGALKRTTEAAFLKGDLAELIVYDSALSASDITKVENYLSKRYGLFWPGGVNLSALTASQAATSCTTPSYDASGQAIHPDVYDAGVGQTWNGYRYWLAETPFTNGAEAAENPTILASTDGDTWVVPDGLTNPIVTLPPEGAFYSDPDLVLYDNTLYCIYRYVPADDSRLDICLRSSTDGVTWSDETVIITTAEIHTITSPSVLHDGSQFVMWAWNSDTGSITRRTCATISGTWSAPQNCSLSGNPGVWHFDVINMTGWYLMVATDGDTFQWLSSSADGITWVFSASALMTRAGAAWDKDQFYRACLVKTATGATVWYSGKSGQAWHIGKTAIAF